MKNTVRKKFSLVVCGIALPLFSVSADGPGQEAALPVVGAEKGCRSGGS